MNRVLILGGSGLVGKAVVSEMNKNKNFDTFSTYLNNPPSTGKNGSFSLNIEDLSNVNDILNSVKPQSVVSCLRGDFNQQLALHIRIAEHLKSNGGRLYFFSTTNVFDNDLSRPHYEDDMPGSCTEYGNYKIECEKKIAEILGDNAIILRLPQVWGKSSPRMINLLNSLNNHEDIVVYPNLFINTNTDIFIAKQLCYIIEKNLSGIFHLSADDSINYKDFNATLINGLGFDSAKFKEDFDEEGFFVLLSKRNTEFPEYLRFTNKSVIDYLTEFQK